MGDEGDAAPHRHPDSDSLTQNCVTFVQQAAPPVTAPPPLLGSLGGTSTATRSPPVPLSRHYPPRPTLRPPLMLSEDISSTG